MTIDDGALPGRDPWGQPVGAPAAAEQPIEEVAPGEVAPGEIAPEGEPREQSRDELREPREPWPLGYLAFGIAVLLVIVEGVAVYLGSFGEPAVATIIGQFLVVFTAFPFALGLLAVIRNRNREWGVAAMVLALIANPFILINVLGFFGAL